MRWPGIETIYGEFLRKTSVFSSEKQWEDLHTRVIEHVRAFRVPTSRPSCLIVERPRRGTILHADNPPAVNLSARPEPKADGGDDSTAGRRRDNMGAD